MSPLAPPRLIVLSDAARLSGGREEAWIDEVLAPVLAAAPPRSVLVQLRHKDVGARRRLEIGARLRSVTGPTGQLLVVNDRLDLARLLQADGIHLPGGGVSVEEARAALVCRGRATPAWVTRAWHGEELPHHAAVTAGHAGAPSEHAEAPAAEPDAWVLSPICAARKGRPALGLTGLERAVSRLRAAGHPGAVYALGGIDAAQARGCLDAGATGVAVLGAAAALPEALHLLAALGLEGLARA